MRCVIGFAINKDLIIHNGNIDPQNPITFDLLTSASTLCLPV